MPGVAEEVDGERRLKPAQFAVLGELVQLLADKLPGIKPSLISYAPFRQPEESDAFVLDFPAAAGEPICYDGLHRGHCEFAACEVPEAGEESAGRSPSPAASDAGRSDPDGTSSAGRPGSPPP